MNRLFATIALLAACGGSPVGAGEQPAETKALSGKDPLCQSRAKTGTDCHSPGSRAAVLKTYLEQQEKLATTNGVKSCDKPPSRAALMQKTAPSAK